MIEEYHQEELQQTLIKESEAAQKTEFAKVFLKNEMDWDFIAETTGLSHEDM